MKPQFINGMFNIDHRVFSSFIMESKFDIIFTKSIVEY